MKNSILDYIKYEQLNWYDHVRRMNEERLPQKICNGVHLDEEEKEDLELSGCRKYQLE